MACSKLLDFAAPTGAHMSFYWTMDEGGVLDKVDSTAGLVWPMLAGTTAAPGLFSNGTLIDNKVRGLGLTNSPSIVVTQASSDGISFWYWVKIVAYGSVGVFCDLNTSGAGNNELYTFIRSQDAVTTDIELFHWNNVDSADIFSPTLSWALGSWHMVAAAYDKVAKTLNLYVDGSLSATIADPFVYPDLLTSTWFLNSPNPVGTVPNMVFDELGLCLNGALTATQVTALWNGGAGMTWPSVKTPVPYP